MKSNYYLSIALLLATISLSAQTQIGQTLTQFELGDSFGASVSMNNDGTRLLTSAARHNTSGVNSSGRVDVYEFDGSNWVQLGQTLTGGTPVEIGQFGRGLDMSGSGNRIAIGNTNSESKVYELNAGSQQWEQMGADLEFPGNPDSRLRRFRFSADENTLVVGGSNAGDDSVYVFQWDGSNWTAVGNPLEIPARDEIAVSADAQTIANVYRVSNAETGINIYRFDGTDWTLEFNREFTPNVFVSDGMDLSANGNRLVMSYWDENAETGTFETYDRVAGNWQASVTTFSIPFDSWNNALRLSDNGTIFIYGSGTEQSVGEQGGARVFEQIGNNWVLVNYFEYDNYDESITGNVFITGDGTKVAFGQAIPFDVGFVKVYDISDILSVDGLDGETFQLYPNPTTGRIHLNGSSFNEIRAVTVLDITGRIVQQLNSNEIRTNSIEIEGPSGTYLVNVLTANSQHTFKVLKQ